MVSRVSEGVDMLRLFIRFASLGILALSSKRLLELEPIVKRSLATVTDV